MNNSELEQLKAIVVRAADEELLPRFTKIGHSLKSDGSLITEADLAMQQRLESELKALFPDYAFVGEEMSEAEQDRLMADHSRPIWILDPIDGTRNFAAGLPSFAPSLGLLQEGEIVAGIVYDPCRKECFSAIKGQGSWLNGKPIQPLHTATALTQSIGLIDYKRLDRELACRLVTEQPFSSQRSIGSVALDWCWLATHRCHVYLHGKQRLWDYAAGFLVFAEAGGQACTLDGEALFQPHLQPRSAVAALDEDIFNEWTRWLGIRPNPSLQDGA